MTQKQHIDKRRIVQYMVSEGWSEQQAKASVDLLLELAVEDFAAIRHLPDIDKYDIPATIAVSLSMGHMELQMPEMAAVHISLGEQQDFLKEKAKTALGMEIPNDPISSDGKMFIDVSAEMRTQILKAAKAIARGQAIIAEEKLRD